MPTSTPSVDALVGPAAPVSPADPATLNLPIIDLSRVAGLAPDHPQALAFRSQLLDAARHVGFFYLVGHGLGADRFTELLEVARRFFALPEADKRAIENVNSPQFRGWTRLGGELTQGQQDWREQIDLSIERDPQPATEAEPWNILEGPNQWPASLPELRTVVTAWQRDLTDVARTLLHQLALALGQPEDVFDHAYDRPSSLVKIVRYPGRSAAAAGSDQGVGAHKDSGVLTLLLCEPGSTGLQVQRDGAWVDAPPVDGAFVVNIGELLEVATQGLLVATNHRVISPPEGRSRISVPFFFNPSLGARFPRLELPADLAASAPGATEDARNRLHETYGGNALKSRLRAHPDVAARHHPQLLASYAG